MGGEDYDEDYDYDYDDGMVSAGREMIDYIRRQILIDPGLEIDEDTPLVSSGLVDSFALVDLLIQLERVTRRKIPSGRVAPQDLDTVRQMLAIAEKLGSPHSVT